MTKAQKIISMVTIFSLVITSFAFMNLDNAYAASKAKKYKVTFNANKGKFTAKKYAKKSAFSKKIKKGKKIGTLPKVKRDGYSLKGWYTKKSGGKKVTKKTKITKKTKVYAQWKAKKYTVKFDANGGTVSTGSKKVTFNKSYGTLPTPSKSGSIFTGWYTAKTGGNLVTSTTILKTNKTHTLYARWEQTITINEKYFDLLGQSYADNTAFAAAFPNLTYSDYIQDEWIDDDDGQTYYYESYDYIDGTNTDWDCYYALTRYEKTGDYVLSDIMTVVKDIIDIDQSYDYKLFMSKIGISPTDYGYYEDTYEGIKYCEVSFAIGEVGISISVDSSTKKIGPMSSVFLYSLY